MVKLLNKSLSQCFLFKILCKMSENKTEGSSYPSHFQNSPDNRFGQTFLKLEKQYSASVFS